MAKKTNKTVRACKWIGELSNHVDRRDDDCIVVWAKTAAEANQKIIEKMDRSRFSLRGVYKKYEK